LGPAEHEHYDKKGIDKEARNHSIKRVNKDSDRCEKLEMRKELKDSEGVEK